jgi:Cdc6-like AAA superfamily ATPase
MSPRWPRAVQAAIQLPQKTTMARHPLHSGCRAIVLSESGGAYSRRSSAKTPKSLSSRTMLLPAKVSRQVKTLLEGSFVDRRENLLLFGKTGTGKTHLLSAIAQELVRAGRKVVSWPCALLVQELLVAKRDLKLSRVLKRLSQCEVRLIDDIGTCNKAGRKWKCCLHSWRSGTSAAP